jgi:hypothetical protein
MKKARFSTNQIIGLVVIGMSVLVVGCGKHESEAPKEGYSGGQKAGAVNNTMDSSGQTPTRGSGGPGATNNMSGSGGGMGSGGR